MKNSSTTMLVLGASFVLAAAMCACGGQGDGDDNGQPADVAGDDTAEPVDTAVPEDEGEPWDMMIDTGNDLGGQDIGTDTAEGPAIVLGACEGADALPRVTNFSAGSALSDSGWAALDSHGGQGEDIGGWRVATTTGALGDDEHAIFEKGDPYISMTAAMVSNCMDASTCALSVNSTGTTVQWRMAYDHADASSAVTLKVLATQDDDFDGAAVLWSTVTDADIEYGLYSVELPDTLEYSPKLRIMFEIETGDATTEVVENWEIDDVVVACGAANANVKSIAYDCPNPAESCSLATAVKRNGGGNDGAPLAIVMHDAQRTMVVLCGRDPDATAATWAMYGYPADYLDSAPMESPSFAMRAAAIGQGGGCDTLPVSVASVCGTPALTETGHFFCAFEFAPNLGLTEPQVFDMGLVVRDEYDPTGVAALHQPFESMIPFILAVNPAE